jgi:hypothetical protein
MEVIEVPLADINKLVDMAREFYSTSEHLDGFNSEAFKANWENIINAEMGVILGLKEAGVYIGGLGILKYVDISTGKLTASENFWYVKQGKRGNGGLLFKAFEKWAIDAGCEKLIMAHLVDSMPQSIYCKEV